MSDTTDNLIDADEFFIAAPHIARVFREGATITVWYSAGVNDQVTCPSPRAAQQLYAAIKQATLTSSAVVDLNPTTGGYDVNTGSPR